MGKQAASEIKTTVKHAIRRMVNGDVPGGYEMIADLRCDDFIAAVEQLQIENKFETEGFERLQRLGGLLKARKRESTNDFVARAFESKDPEARELATAIVSSGFLHMRLER